MIYDMDIAKGILTSATHALTRGVTGAHDRLCVACVMGHAIIICESFPRYTVLPPYVEVIH